MILFLSTVLLRGSKSRRRLLIMGSVYVVTIYLVYLLSGLGLIWFQHQLVTGGYAQIVGMVVGVAVIGLGLVELKDFFWYGVGPTLEIPQRYRARIERMSNEASVAEL